MEVKRGPILFRCDGVPGAWEPLYQCLTLSAALQRRRRGTHFLSYLEPLSLAQTIHRGNNDWTAADTPVGGDGDLNAVCRLVRKTGAAAVVVAGDASPDYLEAVADTGASVLTLDVDGQVRNPGGIVVNPLLAPGRKAYRTSAGTHLLLGRRFALVRPLFRRQRTIRATEQPGPFRALVAFGDDDPADQTLLRAEQLLDVPQVQKVTIACRTHHPRYHELKEFADASKSRVEVVTEPKELMTRLVRAHVAVSGGCGWGLELACVGIPQLTLPATPVHTLNAKRLDDEGAATCLGAAAEVTAAQLAEAVGIILDDPMERLGMNRCGRNLIDGRGGDRIVNGMEIVLHTPRLKTLAAARLAA
jgi:spore coat polysaccharide biosynthesis predicted glycosyltransferase SpsG